MIIHELFEQQSAGIPDAVALVSGEQVVTYAELNHAANRIAWRLLQHGVGREQFVGVRIARSVEAVIAMLGVLKAGAAWVYLEPDLPQVRTDTILQDAQPVTVITPDDVKISGAPAANPGVSISPDDAACLLYTSGSTGQPKGVVEIHRSLTARVESGLLPDITSGDVCALNSSLAFGVTASRFLIPLSLGAKAVVLPEAEVQNLQQFADTLAFHGVTSLFLPAVLLRELLQLDQSAIARLSAIRAVSVTGSSITPALVHAFFDALPRAILVNLYGSTEIGSTAALRVMTSSRDADAISIGHPIPGAKMYVLDDRMQPVAAGQTGQLYVGAPYLARGYLNQPKLTAERFVPDPFAAGCLVYKTGDLARRLPGGDTQLAGRTDHQVKIRGHRVELGEVEAVLERHYSLREAAVVVQGEALVAYVVRKSEVTAGALRSFVREQLPPAMHPAAFRFLHRLPRTSGGKVDRRSLPSYDASRPELDTPFEAPREETEAELARIWSEALNVRQIGIHDYFLDLGGDSLAALRAIVQVEQRFGLRLAMDSLFDRTIASIAEDLAHAARVPRNVVGSAVDIGKPG